jgi:hypothetical protein
MDHAKNYRHLQRKTANDLNSLPNRLKYLSVLAYSALVDEPQNRPWSIKVVLHALLTIVKRGVRRGTAACANSHCLLNKGHCERSGTIKLLYGSLALVVAWAPLFTQVKFSVSTDKAVYQYGDSIHITITAVNMGSVTDTLVFATTCQVNYYVDSFELLQHRACGQVVTYSVISPHDSVTWRAPSLPPYPVTRDTLAIGTHAVVGEVIRYWKSDTVWIKVSPATEVREGNSSSQDYFLEDNYPNPFNPSTRIAFGIPKATTVQLRVIDALGRDVATIVNGERSAGVYKVMWNASNVPSGIYFYRLQAGGFVETKKMILLR